MNFLSWFMSKDDEEREFIACLVLDFAWHGMAEMESKQAAMVYMKEQDWKQSPQYCSGAIT